MKIETQNLTSGAKELPEILEAKRLDFWCQKTDFFLQKCVSLIFCDISETTGFSVPLRYVISQVGISQHIYPNTIYPNTIYPKPFDSSRVVSFAPLIPHLTKETRLVARLVSKANPFISPRDAPSHKLFCYSTPINVKPILQTKRRAFSSRQT